MVRKHSLFYKSAFTLIELIFAIVIIAISVLSLPMMIQSSSKGIEANIVQEVIFATGSILNESTTYYWDSQSINDIATSSGYSRVVNTGGCIGGGIPYKRIGHINRQCLDDNTTTPSYVAGDSNATEYAAVIYSPLDILTGVAAAATYKDSYSALITVTTCTTGNTFTQFGEEANNPNLKEIKIDATPTGSAETLVLLRSYVTNIGEVEPESRIF